MDEEHLSLIQELDNYITFFRSRASVQETHLETLAKLVNKSEEIDRKYEEESTLRSSSTSRTAWYEIRRNIQHEIRANREFVRTTYTVLNNLLSLKEQKDRTRKAMKDQLKRAISAHSEYKVVVSRLKKTYERRVEEYEELTRELDHDVNGHGTESDSSNPATTTREARRSSVGTSGDYGRAISPPPPPVAPAPASPLKQQSFISGATSSNPHATAFRDPPPKSNVFDGLRARDWLAERSKLESVVRAIGNVAKGDGSVGSVGAAIKSSVGGTRNRKELVRLKREAEQADREYREAIYRLETLRIRRNRVSGSAGNAISELSHDLSQCLKENFSHHTESLFTLGSAQVAISDYTKQAIIDINPVDDATALPTSMTAPILEPQVFYDNYFVGECRSLLLGISLVDYVSENPSGDQVPLIVLRCIEELDQHLDFQGLFRVSPNLAIVKKIIRAMEKNELEFSFDDYRDDPATISGILKLYLRQLPTPVFPFPAVDRVAYSSDFNTNPEASLASLARRIKRLPVPNQMTLKALIGQLYRVAANAQVNRMTISNLAVVFSSCIFGEDPDATIESAMQGNNDIVLETLITEHAQLFEGLPFESVASRARGASVGGQQQAGAFLSGQPITSSSSAPGLMSASAPHNLSTPSNRSSFEIDGNIQAPRQTLYSLYTAPHSSISSINAAPLLPSSDPVTTHDGVDPSGRELTPKISPVNTAPLTREREDGSEAREMQGIPTPGRFNLID